jgi:hypothetical protein
MVNYGKFCCRDVITTIYLNFFVTRLIINKIIKVQWVNFKLENVLVSLHSLKPIGLVPFGVYYILDNLIWLYFPLTPIEKSNRPIVYHVVRLLMRFKQGELKVSRHMYFE